MTNLPRPDPFSPAQILDAAALQLTHEPVPDTQQLSQLRTTTALHEVGALGGTEVGIWEMSLGAMSDVEADEYFVVLSGTGTLKVLATAGFQAQEVELFPGALVRLFAGMHTEWQITSTLRKVYLSR